MLEYQNTELLRYRKESWLETQESNPEKDSSFHCCHALKESIALNFSAASDHRQDIFVSISCEKYVTESQFLHLVEIYIWDNHRTVEYDNNKTPKGSSSVYSSWERGCTEMPALTCILLCALCTSNPGFLSRNHVCPYVLKAEIFTFSEK